MRRFYNLALWLLFISLPILAQQQATDTAPQVIQVSQKKPNFSIQLPANPSTGYQWFLQHYNARLIQPLSSTFIHPSNNLIGSPGKSQWEFSAKNAAFIVPQSSKLRFEYRRPWEDTAVKKQTVTVVFIPNK